GGNAGGAEVGGWTRHLTARANENHERALSHDIDKLHVVAGGYMMSFPYTDYRDITHAPFSGKVIYSLDNRDLIGGTVRSDGSSKFAPGHRWGLLPSGAIAWNAHNESFMNGLRESGTLNNLKFRFSYGLIGNENVEPY